MGIDPQPPYRHGNSGSSSSSAPAVVVLAAIGAAMLLALVTVFSFWFYRSSRVYSTPPQVSYVQMPPPVATTEVMYGSGGMGGPPGYVDPQFQARVAAAMKIQDVAERDDAFSTLAIDHAQSGVEGVAAIREILDTDLRDRAAFGAAQRFSEENRPQESMVVVDMIVSQELRDSAYHAIAVGEWPAENTTAPAEATEAVAPAAAAAVDR